MDFTNNETDHLKDIFQSDSPTVDTTGNDDWNEGVQGYAVASGDEILKRFKLLLRNGQSVSIPYALLPVIIQKDGGILYLKAYKLLITIRGRNLGALEEFLSDECLLWARESPSRKDGGQPGIFIKDILIEGETATPDLND